MLIKLVTCALILSLTFAGGICACERDRDVHFQNPLYLNFRTGFFYMQGLSNGESTVIYKHPDDHRVFGQYTFKDDKCLYETVYYFVKDGKYEFTNPYITDETNFNITNKISFVKDDAGYEIEYTISPKGLGIFQNLGPEVEKKILPEPSIKKTPAVKPAREVVANFNNIGKQNLKVSYMKNGENYIQFVTKRGTFKSIEGQYTFRTSDRRYHSITYEVPLDDFDYSDMLIREYEVSTEENFHKTGTLRLEAKGKFMDVKYFVNANGFHIAELVKPVVPVKQKPAVPNTPVPVAPVPAPVNGTVPVAAAQPARPVQVDPRRPLLTGERFTRG